MSNIEYVDPLTLRPHPQNPRIGSVPAIAASIRAHGWYGTVIVQRSTGTILAGAHRVLAAREEGIAEIPVYYVDVDDEQALAILLGDNKIADLGGYDSDQLLAALESLDADLRAVTAYGDGDIRALIRRLAPPEVPQGWPDTLSRTTAPPSSPAATPTPVSVASPASHATASEKTDVSHCPPEAGDVTGVDVDVDLVAKWGTEVGQRWTIGEHRLWIGDCCDSAAVKSLFGGDLAHLAFTSPPYAQQRDYAGSESVPEDRYVDWFAGVQNTVVEVLAEGGSWCVNIKAHSRDGQRSIYVNELVVAHCRAWGWRFVDEFAWVHSGLPGKWDNRVKNQWEPIFHFSRDRYIKFSAERNAQVSSNAFEYTGDLKPSATGNQISWSGSYVDRAVGKALPGNVLKIGKNRDAVKHPAMFPKALPAWFIRILSDPGDVIFDPFLGAGTTMVAAHNEGRVCYGTEISSQYAAVILERMFDEFGLVGERH